MYIELLGGYYYYCFLVANFFGNLENFRCRIIFNIKVVYVQFKFFMILDIFCQGGVYIFSQEVFIEVGIYVDFLQFLIGCDSIVILNLEMVFDFLIIVMIIGDMIFCVDMDDGMVIVVGVENVFFLVFIELIG